MCIIVTRPAKTKPLAKEIWAECWRMHHDGAGLAYFSEEGNLVTDKGFMNFDALYEAVKKIEHLESMVHFRTASPGMIVNAENTHPFTVTGKKWKTKAGKPRFHYAIVHNGRLPWGSTTKRSDTACFVGDVLEPILNQNPFYFHVPGNNLILETAVTTQNCTNKLVIMQHDAELGVNETFFINEKAGNRAHGCWFSNHTWQLPAHSYHGYGAWRSKGDFFGYGVGSEDLDGLNDDKWLQDDEHGWSWSFKFDCWVNFKGKKWTTYLPYRRAPYIATNLAKKGEVPTGWQQVYVNSTPIAPTPPVVIHSAGDQAEMNKPGDKSNILPLEGGVNITVPRDDEVGAERNPLDDSQGVPELDHLSDDEKSVLCKEAVKYLKDMGTNKKEIRKMSTAEKIDWLRDGVKSLCPESESMNYIDLDMWMLANIKDGNLDKKLEAGISGTSDAETQAQQQGHGNN